jgi:hypothetical protein
MAGGAAASPTDTYDMMSEEMNSRAKAHTRQPKCFRLAVDLAESVWGARHPKLFNDWNIEMRINCEPKAFFFLLCFSPHGRCDLPVLRGSQTITCSVFTLINCGHITVFEITTLRERHYLATHVAFTIDILVLSILPDR